MKCEVHTFSDIIDADPVRADGALFRHNNKVYHAQLPPSSSRTISVRRFRWPEATWTEQRRITQQQLEALNTPQQLLRPYAAYNLYKADSHAVFWCAGVIRRVHTSYSHFTSTSTVQGHILAQERTARTLSKDVIAAAIGGYYPDTLQFVKWLRFFTPVAPNVASIAVGPRAFITCRPPRNYSLHWREKDCDEYTEYSFGVAQGEDTKVTPDADNPAAWPFVRSVLVSTFPDINIDD